MGVALSRTQKDILHTMQALADPGRSAEGPVPSDLDLAALAVAGFLTYKIVRGEVWRPLFFRDALTVKGRKWKEGP